MSIVDIVYEMVILSLLSAFVLVMLVVAWAFFEETELWEMIKDWLEKRKES